MPVGEPCRFSEVLTEDGVGVITVWMDTLPDVARVLLETRLVNWATLGDRWIQEFAKLVEPETTVEQFQPLRTLKTIEVSHGGAVYRIIGTDLDTHEFVMLVGEVDPRRRGKLNAQTMRTAEERKASLIANPRNRKEYEI